MKKRIITLIAMALALALLCGCAGVSGLGGNGGFSGGTKSYGSSGHSGSMPVFSEIEYVRPDIDALQAAVAQVGQALSNGSSLVKISDAIDKCYEEYYNFYTMYNLADIRACQNMRDEYYAAEYGWCSDNSSLVQREMEAMLYACAASDAAQKLEELCFWPGFVQEYSDAETAVYNDRSLELMQRESALISEYRALVAAPTIQGDGVEVDYYSYISDLYDEEYSEAMLQYYRKYNEELARIYIDLVKVRHELAETLGYGSYEQMQYSYYFERDYSPEQAAEYIADIKEYMVPFYKSVIAADPYADISYDYLSDTRLFAILRSATEKMGGQVEEAFTFMADYELYDICVSADKAAMSFQTYLTNYEAPFIFLDPYGDTEDILSFAHEFGHYLDAFVNYDAYETIDVSESFSQGMEYLVLSYLDDSLSRDELDNLYRMKMMDTLELYVQQASFAEFEMIVYSTDPELLSAEMLNELSLELAREYGYYDGESEEYYAMSWTDIVHFYEMPFYIISYPVSNDVAMQIYELEQRQEGTGLEKYLEILPRDYEGFMDTVEAGGLQSPFAPGRIQQVVEDMRGRLTWTNAA